MAADLDSCEQPDELIQRAWDAGLDKKLVIREGIDAARILVGSDRNDVITLFWPVPRPLEAVDCWSEHPHPYPQIKENLRPYASAVAPACILGGVLAHFFLPLDLSTDLGQLELVGFIAAMYAVLGIVLKLVIAATLRRQVARLDENAALAMVLEHLRRGMIAHPAFVPLVCNGIRRGLAR